MTSWSNSVRWGVLGLFLIGSGYLGWAEGLGRSGRLAVDGVIAQYDVREHRLTLRITAADGVAHELVTEDPQDIAVLLQMVQDFGQGRGVRLYALLEADEVVGLQVEAGRSP